MTVLDALIQSLSRAGEYNRDDQVPPAVGLVAGIRESIADVRPDAYRGLLRRG
jgi:hypothetical protein